MLASGTVLLTFLYFIQGIPYGFQVAFLPVHFHSQGLSLTSVSLLRLLSIPWLAKLLWAPLVDVLGTKRKWLLGSLFCLAIVCLLAAFLPSNLFMLCIELFLLNVLLATQDIAVDGIAVAVLSEREMGQGNAAQVVGYKLGSVFGGGVLLWLLDALGWTGLFLLLTILYFEAVVFVYLSPVLRQLDRGHSGEDIAQRDRDSEEEKEECDFIEDIPGYSVHVKDLLLLNEPVLACSGGETDCGELLTDKSESHKANDDKMDLHIPNKGLTARSYFESTLRYRGLKKDAVSRKRSNVDIDLQTNQMAHINTGYYSGIKAATVPDFQADASCISDSKAIDDNNHIDTNFNENCSSADNFEVTEKECFAEINSIHPNCFESQKLYNNHSCVDDDHLLMASEDNSMSNEINEQRFDTDDNSIDEQHSDSDVVIKSPAIIQDCPLGKDKMSGSWRKFLQDLMTVPGTKWMIGFVLIYKLGEQGAVSMIPMFLLDQDVSAKDVAFWTGIIGQAASVFGSLMGGCLLSTKWFDISPLLFLRLLSLCRLLPFGSLILILTIWPFWFTSFLAGFAILAFTLLQLIGGALTTATFASMMLCSKLAPSSVQASHYSLLATLEVFGKLVFLSLCGALVDLLGYQVAFLLFLALAIVVPVWLCKEPDILILVDSK